MAKQGRWPKISGEVTLVVALVVVNIILVALLLDRPAPDEGDIASPGLISEPSPLPVPSATPSASPSVEPSPEPEPSPTPPATEASRYVMAAVDGSTAWRVATGACPEVPANPERTVDGGVTWQASDASLATGITAVQRLIASSAEQLALIGFRADGCAPTLVRTFVGGEEYTTADEELGAAWYVPADNRATVHAPQTGVVAAPCGSIVAISAASNTVAAVLCADGSVHATSDSGASFTGGVVIPGAQSLTASGDGWAVAAVGDERCGGVGIFALDAPATTAELGGCFTTSSGPEQLAGVVAIANGAGTLWLWVGDTVARSETSGATWL